MILKNVKDADVKNKCVFLRADFNVELKNGDVQEKFKIESVKETLKYLIDNGAKVAMVTYFGRPDGKVTPEFSVAQIVDDVEKILGFKIKFIADCVGEKVQEGMGSLANNNSEVLLLENVRFYKEEDENDSAFAKKLSENFDIFVNDAFSVCHREQASITGITEFLPSFAGFHLQKEIENLERVMNSFERPAVAIVGGIKIETKVPLIEKLAHQYDFVLTGSGIANEAISKKIKLPSNVILPFDFADKRLDIGHNAVEKYKEIILSAKTIIWNGPMGVFEQKPFDEGTNAILNAVIQSEAFSVVGGGETIQVLEQANAINKISFVSTGGGAMLEFLAKGNLPGVEVLKV